MMHPVTLTLCAVAVLVSAGAAIVAERRGAYFFSGAMCGLLVLAVALASIALTDG